MDLRNIPDLTLIRAEKARRRLYEFVKQAWPVVEPGVPFVGNWHIEEICEHLEAVTMGEILRLLINIPPRHAKSTIVTVMWPMWEWLQSPTQKYLCASYAGKLSIRDSVKSRRLIMSPWYQQNWGHLFSLTGDQNEKLRWENTKTGYRIATSVDGTGTGEGGSRLILDDPHGAKDAQSDAMRENAIEWFDMVWSTRLNNPKLDAMVTVMQRLHEEDVSGHILKDIGGWEHLCIPAEWDGVRRTTSLGTYDPRKNVGELLWPERIGPEELRKLKVTLGEYGTSGQLQQQPSPAGGGIIKVDRFQLIKDLPQCHYVLQSADTAFTKSTENDETAFLALGVFRHNGKNCILVLDAWGERMTYPELRTKMIDEWHAEYGGDKELGTKPKKADAVLIESKGSGISLIQDLRSARIPCIPYNPGNADKIARAHQVAPVIEMDVVYILESKRDPGMPITWARKFIEQCRKFPVAEHDDYVDAFTQGIIYLRDSKLLELPAADPEPIIERDYHVERKKRKNPYAA